MTRIISSETERVIQSDRGVQDARDSVFVSRLAALQTMNAKLMCMTDAGIAFDEMVRSAQRVVGCDSCVLYIFEPKANLLRLKAATGQSRSARLGDILLVDEAGIQVQAFLEEYLVYIPDLLENPESMRIDPELRSELVLPISCKQGPAGLCDFGSKEVNGFSEEEIRICGMLVDQMAFSLDNFRLLADLTASRDAVIRGMALLAESRDRYIGRHLDRICAFAYLLSERLLNGASGRETVDEEFVETLTRSAALHDIGKVGIPDTILMKPGKLTPEEFEVMKSHTTIGGDLLGELMKSHGSFPMLKMGAEVAYSHHEWWDGTGYPQKLKGRTIPLSARIVSICDVFDALTSQRVYKEAWNEEEAFRAIRERSGLQFDPYLVRLFVSLRTQLREIRNRYSD
jgi:HD-GYP domain-containing protein (c-di-GMP phosphodiesterase class II)